jgi:hypothetical protein
MIVTKTVRDCKLVPEEGLEPPRREAGDFESPASTIPPLGPSESDVTRLLRRVNRLSYTFLIKVILPKKYRKPQAYLFDILSQTNAIFARMCRA